MLRAQRVIAALCALTLLVPLGGCSADAELEALIGEARASAAAATSTYVRPHTEAAEVQSVRVPGLAYTPEFSPDSAEGVDGELARLLYRRLYDETYGDLVRVHSVLETGEHRFSLRTDQVFADGQSITLEDVVYSLRRSGLAAESDGKTLVVSGLPGDTDVEALLGRIPILKKDSGGAQFPLPSGSYLVEGSTLCDRDGAACYTLVEVSSPGEALTAYQSGALASLTVFGSEPDAVFPHGRSYHEPAYSRILYSLSFNTESRRFREADARLAAAAAIDREAFASEWLVPAYLFVPSWADSWTQDAEDAAREAFAAAAAPLTGTGREKDAVLLFCDDAGTLRDLAERISEQLAAAGLPVTLDARTDGDYLRALGDGSWDLLLRRTTLPADYSCAELLGDADASECTVTPLAFAVGVTYTHIPGADSVG